MSSNLQAAERKPAVLFVCMGNICRSPTVEGVFRAALAHAGWSERVLVDSAGTGDWHIGSPPDRRAIAAARRRGYDLSGLRARQIAPGDFDGFDLIYAMDLVNLRELEALRPPGQSGHLGLLLDVVPGLGLREVPDPYYGDLAGFERVLDLAEAACEALLARVQSGVISR